MHARTHARARARAQVRGAAFGDSSFEALAIACTSLHRLDVSRNGALGGDWPRLHAAPPSLCELELYACTALRAPAIGSIATACPAVRALNLGGTEHVGPHACATLCTAFAAGGLTKLLLRDSAALTDAALHALRLPSLVEIDIGCELEKSRETAKTRLITDGGVRTGPRHAHTHAQADTQTRPRSHEHTRAHTRTHTRARTRTHARTHVDAYKHPHRCAVDALPFA
jgi:hypothetical protein